MTAKSFKQITQDLNQALTSFRKAAPDTMAGFSAMAKSAMAPGALDAVQKELIALAIGIAARCDGCLGFHIKALVKLGATRQQFIETLEVATYMGGGPSLMYAAEAIRAWEEFGGEGATELKAVAS
jgi:AhpD family alkylhydroperoxidase